MRSKLACLAVLAVGCTVETYPSSVEDLAVATCEVAFDCCDTGETAYYFGPHVTAEDCPERIVRQGELDSSAFLFVASQTAPSFFLPNFAALDLAIDQRRVLVDSGALGLCLDELRNAGCNMPVVPEDPEDPDVPYCPRPAPEPDPTLGEDGLVLPCLRIFLGNVGEGGECSTELGGMECVQGTVCRVDETLGTQGVCVRLGLDGDYCTDDNDCNRDLYCAQLDRTCRPYRTLGETCATSEIGAVLLECAPELDCDEVTDTCVPECTLGADCFGDEQCDMALGLSCISFRCDTLRGLGLPCDEDDDCEEGLECGIPSDAPPGMLPVCIEQIADGEPCFDHGSCLSEFCDPMSDTCARRVAAGMPCPSRQSQQCVEGSFCDAVSLEFCTTDADCDGGMCDTVDGLCLPICVALLADGEDCISGSECASRNCIVGMCRTPPLALGMPCDSSADCESEFCGLEEERVCTELPLALGARCSQSDQCESAVCFGTDLVTQICTMGAAEGELCGPGLLPCDPLLFYCDTDAEEPVCTALRETGAPCEDSQQCRGDCVVRFAREMCSNVAPPDAALCDGAGGGE
jgi:hypothetical protein